VAKNDACPKTMKGQIDEYLNEKSDQEKNNECPKEMHDPRR